MFNSREVFLSNDPTSFVADTTGNRVVENSYCPSFHPIQSEKSTHLCENRGRPPSMLQFSSVS